MGMGVISVFIADGNSEHNILMVKGEFGVGDPLSPCVTVAVSSAKSRQYNIGSGGAIDFDYIIFNIKGIDFWRIFTACAVEFAIFKG